MNGGGGFKRKSKNGMKSVHEMDVECVRNFEKKKKRVLPDWITNGGKKMKPPNAEKIDSVSPKKSKSKESKLEEKNLCGPKK